MWFFLAAGFFVVCGGFYWISISAARSLGIQPKEGLRLHQLIEESTGKGATHFQMKKYSFSVKMLPMKRRELADFSLDMINVMSEFEPKVVASGKDFNGYIDGVAGKVSVILRIAQKQHQILKNGVGLLEGIVNACRAADRLCEFESRSNSGCVRFKDPSFQFEYLPDLKMLIAGFYLEYFSLSLTSIEGRGWVIASENADHSLPAQLLLKALIKMEVVRLPLVSLH